MHHFVVKFSKFSSPGRQGSIDPLTKILQTFLDTGTGCPSVSVWPCLCLSQVGVISKRMDEIIWVLAWGLFSTSPLLRFKKIQISTKIRVLPSPTFFLNSGVRKFRHGIGRRTCYQLSSRKVVAPGVINWTVVGRLS